MKTVEMLINEIKSSEILQKQLAEAAKNNTVAAFLADQGCEAGAETFFAALKSRTEALDDTALDRVAGGINVDETILSIFTAGIGCAIVATISAAESGVGDGPNDQILCNNEYPKQV